MDFRLQSVEQRGLGVGSKGKAHLNRNPRDGLRVRDEGVKMRLTGVELKVWGFRFRVAGLEI